MNRYELFYDGLVKVLDTDTGNIGIPCFDGLYLHIILEEDNDRYEVNATGTELLDTDTGNVYPMEIAWYQEELTAPQL